GRQLEEIAGGTRRLTRAVHEGHGLEQADVLAGDFHARHFAVKFLLRLEAAAETASEFVHQPEAGVVAGRNVIGPGVSEAAGEPYVLHDGWTRSAGDYSPAASPPPSSSPSAASSLTRAAWMVTTAWSCSGPCARSAERTPSGSLMSEMCSDWPTSRLATSTSMNCGRSFGRQNTSS